MTDVKPFVVSDPNSWVARAYIYYLKVTDAPILAQEYFCHFSRAVVFWATLEWLFLTKRGWRGILRPYEVLALILYAAVVAVFALAVGDGDWWGVTAWVAYGLIGVFGTAAFFEEELESHDSRSLRLGLVFSGVWGSLLLALVVMMLAIIWCDHWRDEHPRSSQPKREKKPSETWEFLRRLFGQIHARVCPPVEFKFDLWQATGRKEKEERWDESDELDKEEDE